MLPPCTPLSLSLLPCSLNKRGQCNPPPPPHPLPFRRGTGAACVFCVCVCVGGVGVQRDTGRHKAFPLMRLGFD